LGKGIACKLYRKGKSRRATVGGSQTNLSCAGREDLGTLIFIAYVNGICRNIELSMRLLADNWISYRKITNKNIIGKIQKYLNYLGKWAVENGMKINPDKSKGILFTKDRVKNPLGYNLGEQKFGMRAVVNCRA